ncbi:MAG: hemD, partial [Blastococcus sp.]|nr:hemD [Blastococcus sp.]
MTRFRKTSGSAGRVVFVGAGPGDPGMLTARAGAALAEAAMVLVDPDVSPAVQDAIREAHPALELSPAVGEPAEVAKAAVAAAKGGAVVVRLVAGDPYTADAVVKEVLAVGRTSVPFDVVPGVAMATAVPAYAGVALGSTAVTADLRSDVDLVALAGTAAAGATLVLQGTAEDLPEAAARLIEGGLSGSTAIVVTTGGSGTAQKSVVAKLVAVAEKTAGVEAFTGPVVATVGTAVDKRARLSWWESRPLFGWRVLVPRTKDQAGEMSERLRAYGAVPVEVPTIAVEPPRSPAQMDRAIKGL